VLVPRETEPTKPTEASEPAAPPKTGAEVVILDAFRKK
jgi:hypothetical protein